MTTWYQVMPPPTPTQLNELISTKEKAQNPNSSYVDLLQLNVVAKFRGMKVDHETILLN